MQTRQGTGRAARQVKVTLGPVSAFELEEARTAARALIQKARAGIDPRAGVRAQSTTTVAAVLDQWIALDQARNRTVEAVRRAMQRDVIPVWGRRQVGTLTRADVLALVERKAVKAPTQANLLLAYVRRFFAWCVARDLVATNPAAGVEKPGRVRARDRVLDDNELALVWRAAEAIGGPFGAGVRVLILTGARSSEVFKAMRAELREDSGRAWLELPAERSKTERARRIWLSPEALAIVRGLPRIGRRGFIFTRTGRAPVNGFGKDKRLLDAKIAEAGPALRPWVLHDLRRSVATGLQQLGARLEAVEALLGHESGSRSGIVGIYQRHRFEAEAFEAASLWAEHVRTRLKCT